jgi:hypothetical protein
MLERSFFIFSGQMGCFISEPKKQGVDYGTLGRFG